MNDTKDVTNVPENQLPANLDDILADVGLGGKVTAADIAIPYLEILQGLSPQVQPASPKYLKGAIVSNLFLTVMDEFYPGDIGLDIVPCFYERVHNEWTPRSKGGGLVKTYDPEAGMVAKGKATDPNKPAELYLPNGNLIIDTMYHYILTGRPEKGWTQTIFPLKSTMLKHSRKWTSNLETMLIPGTAHKAPRWMYKWRLTTMPEDKKGNIWYVPAWKQGDRVDMDTYKMAKDYAKIAATGMLRRPMEESLLEGDEANSLI